MLREIGTFTEHNDDGFRALRSAEGLDWLRYTNIRGHRSPMGALLRLFDHDGYSEIEIGSRWFADVREGEVMFVCPDPSQIVPVNATVIEADEPIKAGMRYVDGEILPAPPEPHVRDRGAVINSFDDDQFELWDERFRTAPARQRVTWNNGSTFTSSDDAWPTVQALFVHVFGEEVGKSFFPDHPTA